MGFNEYYKIVEDTAWEVREELDINKFYIYRNKRENKYLLDSLDEKGNFSTYNTKNLASLQELSNEINKTSNPNILNKELLLEKGGLPVCLVNQYRVYQMTTNDVQKTLLKKISRYITDIRKNRKPNIRGGGSEDKLEVMNGGATKQKSPLERHLNALTDVQTYDANFEQRGYRIVDKLIEKMFAEIDKSYSEDTSEEKKIKDLNEEIQKIKKAFLDKFLNRVNEEVEESTVKTFLKSIFSEENLRKKLTERAGFQDKTGQVIRQDAEQKALKYNERFHSEFLYQEGYSEVKNLFGNFSVTSNCINFYVRKAFGYTESEIEERHQSYMVLVIYRGYYSSLIEKVIETFEFLRDSIYEDEEGKKSKESVFYDIITKNFIRLRKRNYENIKGWHDDSLKGESQKKIFSVFAIEFYSASRNVPVSSIIEFIKMLIEYTRTKYELKYKDIKYQLINKKEEDAKKVDA